MLISQVVRVKPYGQDPNNPAGLTDDILDVGKELSGSGAPDPSLGKIGDKYFDLLTTYNYQKNSSGVWEPLYSISASLPSMGIPDPLLLNEIQVDTIKGKTSDSVAIDAGLNGDINLTLGGINSLNINGTNTQLYGNGNITSQSDITGYTLISDNNVDKSIILNANTSDIQLIGPTAQTIKATNPGATLTLQANDANLIMNTGALNGRIETDAGLLNTSNNTFFIEHQITGEDIELKAEATGAGNVRLRPGASGQVEATENLSMQGNEIIDCVKVSSGTTLTAESGGILYLNANSYLALRNNTAAKILTIDPAVGMLSGAAGDFRLEHITPAQTLSLRTNNGDIIFEPVGGFGDMIFRKDIQHDAARTFTIENTSSNQDLLIKSAGVGNLRLNSSSGTIEHETAANFSPFGLSTSSINSSETLTQAKALITTNSGALVWGEPWRTITFNKVNIATATATVYLDIAGLAVNPADVPCFPILESAVFLRRVSSILISSAPWSFNGGTANLEIGYIPLGSPCIDANFVNIATLPLSTAGDYYYSLSRPNVSVITGKICCRLVTNGTAPTNSQAELVVDVMVGG